MKNIMMSDNNTVVIVLSCLIQLAIFFSLTYSYKYCFKGIETLIDDVTTLGKKDLKDTSIEEVCNLIKSRIELSSKLNIFKHLTNTFIAFTLLTIVLLFNNPSENSLTGIILSVLTTLCTIYSIVLVHILMKSLNVCEDMLLRKKYQVENYVGMTTISRMYRWSCM